jgi:hypothetical protein
LGPLVLGAAVFRVPARASALKELLAPTTSRRGPVPVDDSKLIYRSGAGAGILERSVLAFRALSAGGQVPDPCAHRLPWGPGSPVALPVFSAPEEIAAAREALRAAVLRAGVEVVDLSTRTLGVPEFNRGVERTGSKARVLFEAAMDLVEPWLEERGEIHVHVDRHGGRRHYSAPLAKRLPGRFHFVVEERPERSAYRFPRDAGDILIDFVVRGDGKHLTVGLASMAAKYVREVHMRAFNRWFSREAPGLLPTAGYAVDAARWLAETVALRERLHIPDAMLIRER